MPNNATAMLLSSFTADTLALGAHWIYDTDELDKRFGIIDGLLPPLHDSYHKHKNKGDFTHYGDQALILLRSIAESGGFSLPHFKQSWQQLFSAGYDGYIDKATSTTMANLESDPEQLGSLSADLGGAARIAPLVFYYQDDRDQLVAAVREQTAMTHNNPVTLAGAEFIATTAFHVLAGNKPGLALEAALDEGVADMELDMRIRAGLDSAGKKSRATIKQFGQMCGISAALPGAIHLIITHENDLRTALLENVMAGGDSAARGLVTGMILGAHLGITAIPQQWLVDMKAYEDILELLTQCKAQ